MHSRIVLLFSLPILRGLTSDLGFSKADKRIKNIGENTIVTVEQLLEIK